MLDAVCIGGTKFRSEEMISLLEDMASGDYDDDMIDEKSMIGKPNKY